jgi:hypothetical protein
MCCVIFGMGCYKRICDAIGDEIMVSGSGRHG